jgi:FtsH-binding integral membrane protein
MKAELIVAGVSFFVTAIGHSAVGLRWVLPDLRKQRLSRTPFGPPEVTHAMVRVTWHIVTLMLVAFGVLLTTLGSAPEIDSHRFLLRWFAVLLLAVTALMFWSARDNLRDALRLPVPVLMVFIAAMCWKAAG